MFLLLTVINWLSRNIIIRAIITVKIIVPIVVIIIITVMIIIAIAIVIRVLFLSPFYSIFGKSLKFS